MSSTTTQHPWPIRFTYNVKFGDIDSNQHVNNLAFFRLFQEARTMYTFPMKQIAPSSVTFVVANVSLNFRKQVMLFDTLHCRGRVWKIGRSSMQFAFECRRDEKHDNQLDNPLVCDGNATYVVVDNDTGKGTSLHKMGLDKWVIENEYPLPVEAKSSSKM